VFQPVIYVLVDPREPDHARYVGQSSNPPSRLAGHLTTSGGKRKNEWVGDLLANHIEPEMWVVEECNPEELSDREFAWIDKLSAEGHDLLNGARIPETITKYGVKYTRASFASSDEQVASAFGVVEA